MSTPHNEQSAIAFIYGKMQSKNVQARFFFFFFYVQNNDF